MNRPVARGVLIREEHIETLKRLPNKTMDAVLGAAFRVAIGEMGALAVKDSTGILDAVVQSIAVAALKFDENEKERRNRDAERKRRKAEEVKNGQIPFEKGDGNRLQGDKNRLQGDKRGLKGIKGESARKKEGRKEGSIYTPISPKGNLRFPPEVDIDAMLGEGECAPSPLADARSVGGGENGTGGAAPRTPEEEEKPARGRDGTGGAAPRTPDGGTEEEVEPSEEVTVAEVAARMEARHPNPAGTDSFPKSLVRYLKKNSGAARSYEALLGEIEASHRRWIDSGVWDEKDGRYAPQLKNWLWGGDWKRLPPEKKRARHEEDADDFHVGASL